MKKIKYLAMSLILCVAPFLQCSNDIVPQKDINKVMKNYVIENAESLEENYVLNSQNEWVTSNGKWDSRFANYNCYAYVIDRKEQNLVSGNYYNRYSIGSFSGLSYSSSTSVNYAAQVVKSDLESIGFTNVQISTSRFTVPQGKEMICLRKQMQSSGDFHFMKYLSGEWYHKPGDLAVLKYKYDVSNDRPWRYEGFGPYGVLRDRDFEYNSQIWYIMFDTMKYEVDSSLNKTISIQNEKGCMIHLDYPTSISYVLNISGSQNRSVSVDTYDSNFDYIGTTSGTSICLDLSSKNIRHVRLSYIDGGQGNISFNCHSHSYQYTWINKTRHKASCSCGVEEIQPHVVINSGSLIKKCALCGGTADIGLIGTLSLFSINRSYILPNGVIVLTPSDFELYLKGELDL